MNLLRKISFVSLTTLGILTLGCLDPYNPPVSKQKTDYLVVDGHINSTDNIATVKISRAINLSDSVRYPAESGAIASIEDNNGQLTPLSEISIGVYSASKTFDENLTYRLKVTTRGKEYISEFIQLQKNTTIDSVSWKPDETELSISISAHDFSEGAKYYRYDFEETNEYTSTFFSTYKFINGQAIFRPFKEDIHHCWITRPSTNILVASTAGLNQNIISNFNINNIRKGDRRLWIKYSIIIYQLSLSKEAFNYWSQLKKITESLGGLFDPVPYQIQGNIRSESDPKELVIGYFSGGEVSEKRIIITNRQLPFGFDGIVQNNCQEQYIEVNSLNSIQSLGIVLTRAEYLNLAIVGYWYSTPGCVDCRLEGGANVKPDFMN